MVKNLPANAGDKGLIPGSGKSPEGGNRMGRYPLQCSCLKKIPWTEEPGGLELDTTAQLSTHALVQMNKSLGLKIKGYYDL